MFQQLKQGLAKTRGRLSSGLKSLLLGKSGLDDDLLEDIEMQLLSSDVGVDATSDILKNLKTRFSENSRPLKQWVKVFAAWQERVRRRST